MGARDWKTARPDERIIENLAWSSKRQIRRQQSEFRVHGCSADIFSPFQAIVPNRLSLRVRHPSAKMYLFRRPGSKLVFFEYTKGLFGISHPDVSFKSKVAERFEKLGLLGRRLSALVRVHVESECAGAIFSPARSTPLPDVCMKLFIRRAASPQLINALARYTAADQGFGCCFSLYSDDAVW